MSDFIVGEDLPLKKSKYMKLKQGENKFRILKPGISGYEFWVESDDGKRSPVRVKTAEEVQESMEAQDQTETAKYFMAFKVWNYNEKAVQILELTQRSLQEALTIISKNPKWGNPQNYDITITKTGEKMDTRYQLVQDPPEKISEEVSKASDDTYVNLEALYEGGDPFTEIIDAKNLPF